jgi:hypothetical protein
MMVTAVTGPRSMDSISCFKGDQTWFHIVPIRDAASPLSIFAAANCLPCFWLCERCSQDVALEFHQGEHHPALVARRIVADSFRRVEYKY